METPFQKIHDGDMKYMGGHWDSYIEQYGYMLKEGDKVKVIEEFWFYWDFYDEGEVFMVEAGMVGHNFEKYVEKI